MASIKKSGALLCIDSSDQMLPRGDNEDCREAVYISYSWRGIIRGLQALNKRSWRMGDATQIGSMDSIWCVQETSCSKRVNSSNKDARTDRITSAGDFFFWRRMSNTFRYYKRAISAWLINQPS